MMTINRNNYEQYFLLWVDGELSPEEMVAVERFIAEHPDLAEELALLQDTKLVPEEQIVYSGKEQLLKHSTNEISFTNYESWFLLFIDNELSLADRQKVELFVLQHPNLQAEFQLLVQTKLAPEEWVFKNKELLYRKEEQKRPVVYMRWMRYASAAAVIGLIATVWMIAPNNQLKTTIEINGTQPEMVGNEPASNLEKREIVTDENSKNTIIQVDTKASVQVETPSSKVITAQPLLSNNSLETIINNEPAKKEEQTIARAEHNTISTRQVTISDNVMEGRNDIGTNQGVNMAPVEEKVEAAPEEVKTVYTALEDIEEDKSLFIGALEINKDKLRGFFRKAGTIFRSKAKQEEDTRQRK
jgi:hypothetical protein